MGDKVTEFTQESPRSAKDRRTVSLVYILYFVGFFSGFSAFIGVVIAHTKSGDAGPVWQSHLEYQMRTFWYGVATIFVGVVFLYVVVGWFILLWWFIWTVVRCVKGSIAANDERPIDDPRTMMW